MKDLKTFVKEVNPDYLVSSLIAELNDKEFDTFFEELESFYDLRNLHIGGYQLSKHKRQVPKQVHLIQKLGDIIL